jgi:hypothetical protein
VSTIQLERTLVKSPPELWEELSDIERWLGDVEVARRDPPTSLLWSGRGARGTIELEASGWGTKVRARVEMDRGLLDRFRGTDDESLDVERRLTELLDHLGSSSLQK